MATLYLFVATFLLLSASSATSQASYTTCDSLPGKDFSRCGKQSGEYLQLFAADISWSNNLVLGPLLPRRIWSPWPRVLQIWLRNYIAGLIVYFVSGGLWCFYIYYWKRHVYIPADSIPSKEPIFLQIMVTMKAMPLYSALPTLSEYMIENGWTKCFANVHEVGWPSYILLTILYLVLVEFGIYWMHRELHDIKVLYKYLHATHHIYNKQNTLSPFAGLAFHPLDGILQAIPHVIVLFLIPTHFLTHELLLFCEGIWTTNIHDCIHGKVWPIMGAGYHTIHHTTYRHNYGHYTIWMDWMFGTLRDPTAEAKSLKEM